MSPMARMGASDIERPLYRSSSGRGQRCTDGGSSVSSGGSPEEQGDLLVLVGQGLRPGQAECQADSCVGLAVDGHDLIIRLAGGGGDLDVGDAGLLGLSEVQGHVHQGHALGRVGPSGFVALALGHG